MSDLISRQAAIEIVKQIKMDSGFEAEKWMAINKLRDLPSEEPERKTGIWILSDIQNKEDNENWNYAYICSNCFRHDIQAKTAVVPYCWYCGAKMKRGAENG